MNEKTVESEFEFDIPSCKEELQWIKKEIEKRVKEKSETGIYEKYNLAKIHTLELQDIEDESEFLDYYLKAIKTTWAIDINDWEIINKGGIFGKPIVLLKKIIWKLLKFYTFRLWSQQREFNAQVANTINAIEKKYKSEIENLKKEINALKNKK